MAPELHHKWSLSQEWAREKNEKLTVWTLRCHLIPNSQKWVIKRPWNQGSWGKAMMRRSQKLDLQTCASNTMVLYLSSVAISAYLIFFKHTHIFFCISKVTSAGQLLQLSARYNQLGILKRTERTLIPHSNSFIHIAVLSQNAPSGCWPKPVAELRVHFFAEG